MLDSPDMRRWLDDVEPAWTLLDDSSFNALRYSSLSPAGAIRLATNLTADDAERSAVARNTRVLLDAAANGPGLKLTATGNLARSIVADMVKSFTWPGFDEAYEFRLHKVVNEPDYLPLFFIRHVAEGAKCLRKYKGHLTPTKSGRRVLDPANAGALQAVLFHTTFWQLSLSYLARELHGAWPQNDVGLVLWCLSVAAGEDRDAVERMGVWLRLRRAQADAGDIVLLYRDESEALTPGAFAMRNADPTWPMPGRSALPTCGCKRPASRVRWPWWARSTQARASWSSARRRPRPAPT